MVGISFPLLRSTKHADDGTIEIPLKFLPLGGCLAVKLSVNDKRSDTRLFAYSAIVDTGSPFVTAPPEIQRYAKDETRRYPPTQEQYGETLDRMQWGSVTNVEILTNDIENPLDIPKLVAGLPGSNVVDDTGGIFLGLILEDEARPPFLQQIGYRSFVLDYPRRILTLSKQSILDPLDPGAMELFDFSPYGDNIHHYGVLCPSFQLITPSKSTSMSSLDRPVVAVIDSGLTGCVFSDSLRNELLNKGHGNAIQQLTGLKVNLQTASGEFLTLVSHPEHWFLASFKLPWFTDDAFHPHVIALGATFLAKNSKVTVDPVSKRLKITCMSK